MLHSLVSRYVVPVLIIVSFAVLGAVLAEASSPAQEGQPRSPESCATCHVDVVEQWQTGLHAQAYSDPVFQEAWQSQGSDIMCLACHTTGFNARTGDYRHEGVACEACHGETPANHPPESMVVEPGVEVCAQCHATTYTEWQQSAHGQMQLSCTTCHQPHPQTLRFETANALCLNCHDAEARDDYVHLTHAARECVDCHWFQGREEDLIAHYESGALFPTGHTTHVETAACVSCHAEITANPVVQQGEQAREELGLTTEHPLLEAQVRIEELEAELDTVDAQGANTSTLRLFQGLLVGAAVGAVAVYVVTRARRRSP